MSASIFQPEISTLESQVAALQAQIAAAKSRITLLNEAESVADGALQALQGAVEKVTALAPSAIATFQSKVLSLFGGGDNCDDGNGNQPNPEPKPSDDGGCESKLLPLNTLNRLVKRVDAIADAAINHPGENLAGTEVAIAVVPPAPESSEDVSATTAETPMAAIAVQLSLATGQSCQLEDAPESALAGQSVELAQIAFSQDGFKYLDGAIAGENFTRIDAPLSIPDINDSTASTSKEPEYFELIPISDSVAYFRNNHTGEIAATYVGFNSKSKAEKWGKFLTVDYTIASSFELRDAKRLSAFKYDIKLWNLSLSQIEKLADSDLQKSPHSSYGKASKRKPEPVFQSLIENNSTTVPKPLQIDDVEVGDIVRSTTIKNWQYKVLGITDGMYICEQINVEVPIKVTMHPASVELVSKVAEAMIASPKNLTITPEQAKADLFGGGYDEPAEQQEIEANDWVELLVTGDRYQVDSVDAEGIHLVTNDGNMLVQSDEVKLLFRVPADWKPF